MYTEGYLTPQDDTKALKRYRLAAEQEYVRGQRNLGHMVANGRSAQQQIMQGKS